jgi:hypothetical protein
MDRSALAHALFVAPSRFAALNVNYQAPPSVPWGDCFGAVTHPIERRCTSTSQMSRLLGAPLAS